MVFALGPGKFYGSSLPRPRFVNHNSERVGPPLPVNDALLNWAHEAHWSMGGVNFTRHRFQGRIEGNVEKLRLQREKQFKAKSPKTKKNTDDAGKKKFCESPSPPRAPLALKRRRVVSLVEKEDRSSVKRGAVRKLDDDFERVARESGIAVDNEESEEPVVARRKRSKREEVKTGKRKLVKVAEKIVTRSSPRFVKS